MFQDERAIHVVSGKGGDGVVAFRHEKFAPRGGPAGGSGGRGGSVMLRASPQLTTFFDMEDRVEYRAPAGKPGEGSCRTGASGSDLVIDVPVGTIVRDRDEAAVLGDLDQEGATLQVAAGGRGGRVNATFATANNQTPRERTVGGQSEARWLRLELKLLADVGLVGLPNAGKSTLLSRISRARPRIADYPFTTLEPHLGIVAGEGYRSFTVADLPGLIEGAHTGTGLGHRFLRHVERTRVLVHVVDLHGGQAGSEGPGPLAAYRQVRAELEAYGRGLGERPEIVAANKRDLGPQDEALKELRAEVDREIIPLSGVSGEGLSALLAAIVRLL